MAANATVMKELNGLKHSCNPLNVSHTTTSRKKLDTSVGMDDNIPKMCLVFREVKESVINVGKMLRVCQNILGMKHSTLQAQNIALEAYRVVRC
jgi:hypothetical protein